MKWIFCFFVPLFSFAQEQFGAAFSNYTPTNSVFINPSSMLDAKVRFDFHIVGFGTYLNNNLVSLNNTNYSRIIRDRGVGIDETDIEYHQNKKKYNVYNRTFAQAISGVWSQGNHAVGLFFNARSYTAVRGIPDFVARFIENGIPPYTPQHDINYNLKNLRVASVNFAQIQLSYGYTFYKRRRDMLMAGVSLKKFLSIGGAALNLYNADFNVQSGDTLAVFSFATDAMYTPQPALYSKGGYGFDIGFTYQKMMSDCSNYLPNSKKNGCREIPYKYMLGISLMDVGSVKFDPNTTPFVGYEFSNFEWIDYANQEVSEDSVLLVFAAQDSDLSSGRVKKTNKIRLPTCISLQGDYNLWASMLYANASIVQGLPVSKNKFGVRRANSLMVGLRFETKILDVSLPISLYEYYRPQVGLAVRLYCLTIGTDKLFTYIGSSDLYGADIYAHLKIPIFYHPKCKPRKRQGSSNPFKKKRKGKNCDAYN